MVLYNTAGIYEQRISNRITLYGVMIRSEELSNSAGGSGEGGV